MSKTIVVIAPNGDVVVKVEGAPGQLCHAASEVYEKLVGGKKIETRSTPEALLPTPLPEIREKVNGND